MRKLILPFAATAFLLVAGSAFADGLEGTYKEGNKAAGGTVTIKKSGDTYLVDVETHYTNEINGVVFSCGFTGKGKLSDGVIQAKAVNDNTGEEVELPIHYKNFADIQDLKPNEIAIVDENGISGPGFCGAGGAAELSGRFTKKK